jgi:dihydrofolate synthase/folylpolyglutamate synthase
VSEALARCLAALYARIPLGMRLGLEPMQNACARLDHPEATFPAVHVAGTNGKGSVCAMVESIARAAGMRTGLYTSPHLCRFAERIRIDGEPLEDAALSDLLERALREAPDLSFFETATLAAFLAFREANVDIAVLEVGIGGRLDATNVIPPPRVAAITRIALDHTDRLGPTLADIAREKTGIAKPGVPIALGPMEPGVLSVLEAEVAGRGATTIPFDEQLAMGFSFYPMNLVGAHQHENAAVACALGRRLGIAGPFLDRGIVAATWPGRLELLEMPDGPVLLDAAHNPDGIAAVVAYLQGARVDKDDRGALRVSRTFDPAKTALVFGALGDKAWGEMLDRLVPVAARRFYPPFSASVRGSVSPERLVERAPGVPCTSVADAMNRARASVGPGGLVLVTGSIFLVGEVRALLLHVKRDPAVAL